MNNQLPLFESELTQSLFRKCLVAPIGGKIEKKLSPRELEIMTLMAGGYKYGQMALRFKCSERTIISRVKGIRKKLNCSSSTSAIFILTVEGLITRETIAAL